MEPVREWLKQANHAVTTKDKAALSALLNPNLIAFNQLRQTLRSPSVPRETSFVPLTRSFFPDYTPLADFLAAFLLFARDADLVSNQPELAASDYQLIEDVYRVADKVFAQGDSAWFVPSLRILTQLLVALAFRTGRLSGDPNLTKAGEAARILGRPMGIAAADRNFESSGKREALFFLANSTFKIYFALKNLRLCDTIINNTQNATTAAFPKADQVAFAYYRGRIFLYQRRVPQARRELQKAFAMCHNESWSNGRLILSYLVAASLPLGIFPSEDLLQYFDLQEQYGDLIPALQLGDFSGVLVELDRWKGWHLNKGNYLFLKEKLEVVCWRNLARRTLFVCTNGSPLPLSGPPTLSLHALLTTARISFNDPTLDIDDIESMCASLMDQGYIKAYLLHSKRLLVLQKGPMVGFPPIAAVHPK